MKTKVAFVFLYFLIFPSLNSLGTSLLTPTNAIVTYPNLSLSGEGVSHYNISQSVTYEVVINFTLTHKSGVEHIALNLPDSIIACLIHH